MTETMPNWLLALLITLGAMTAGGLAGWLLFRMFFAPLYRRDR